MMYNDGIEAGWWWLEHDWIIYFYDFPSIGNVIIPTDELIFFRGIETTNQEVWKLRRYKPWLLNMVKNASTRSHEECPPETNCSEG